MTINITKRRKSRSQTLSSVFAHKCIICTNGLGIQSATGRPDKKKIHMMLFKRMTKMIWLVNNLRNIFMSGNSQK